MRYRKPPKPSKLPTILYDDREKNPWLFLQDYGWPMKCRRLKTGDYTFLTHAPILAIEKKSGIQELLNDLTGAYRNTFRRMLQRLGTYSVKLMIVEGELSSYEIAKSINILRKVSRGKCRLTANTIPHWITEITALYQIPMLFLGKSNAEENLNHVMLSLQARCLEYKRNRKAAKEKQNG